MGSEEYPQQLTEDEEDLGFQRLLIDGIGRSPLDPAPTPVIAKILSAYDVLIKINDLSDSVKYRHSRHGYVILPNGEKSRTLWRIVSGPHKDIALFLHEYELDIRKDIFNDVIGVPFTHKASS